VSLAAGAVACLLVVVADVRTLLELGGPRTWVLYELALVLLLGVALVVVSAGPAAFRRPSDLALAGIGAALMAQVLWRSTVDARGWLHLLAGWSAFFVAYRTSSRRLGLGGFLLVLLTMIVMGGRSSRSLRARARTPRPRVAPKRAGRCTTRITSPGSST
jgi:hypothetical protein